MSVKYDVVFKDGARIKISSAACFGGMAQGYWNRMSGQRIDSSLSDKPASEQSFIQWYPAMSLHPMYSHEYPEIRRDWRSSETETIAEVKKKALGNYLQTLKEVFDDMPMLKGVLTIHPLLGVVRAHLKDHKADKIILALFLARNLAHYSDKCYTYRYFRAQGYRPRIAVMLAHLFGYELGTTFSAGSFRNQQIGEYNWLNPDTFGKEAFLRMARQDELEFNFKQQPWRVQRGYRRDHEYEHDPDHVFDERYIGYQWDYENDRLSHGDYERSNNHYYWNLVDALSISGDEPITNTQKWNPVAGFYFGISPYDHVRREVVETFLAEVDALLAENNISKSLEG